MKTFPHAEVTKAVMVADMIAHRKADELVAGIYGDFEDGKFRGCAVGCSIHTINRLRGTNYGYGDYAALAAEIGAPLALVQLQDCAFENLRVKDRKRWLERFYRAMPEGVDLSAAVPRILVRLLREVALLSVAADEWGVRDAIVEVCAAIESGDKSRIRRAAHAAHAAHAAYAAGNAAYATAYAAANAADAAVYAAYAGADHAAEGGAYNTSKDAWRQIADIICEEMERCGEGWVR